MMKSNKETGGDKPIRIHSNFGGHDEPLVTIDVTRSTKVQVVSDMGMAYGIKVHHGGGQVCVIWLHSDSKASHINAIARNVATGLRIVIESEIKKATQ